MSHTVIVDPGHGGHDPGALGTRLKEKDIVLKIANYLVPELKRNGINAIPTRTSDVYVEHKDRTDLAHKHNADLFFSIHINSSTNKGAEYISTFIYSYGGEKERAAKAVQEEIAKASGFRDVGIKLSGVWVLRKTRMPAILTENGFISNLDNEKWLSKDENLKKLAVASAKGICNYFNVPYKVLDNEEAIDINKPSDWAKSTWEDAIKKGYTDGTRPQDNITRQEAMAMIYKVLRLSK